MKKKGLLMLLVSSLFFVLTFDSNGQGQANVWYTGGGAFPAAGLDFNTNPPTLLTNGNAGMMDGATGEASGSICDANGNLHFYTNGKTVYDKTHTSMPLGTGLNSSGTVAQAGLVIPINGFPRRYFVMCQSAGAAVKYVIVNMDLQGNGAAFTVSSVTNVGGFAQLNLSAAATLVVNDYVSISAGGITGVYQISQVLSTTQYVTTATYINATAGTAFHALGDVEAASKTLNIGNGASTNGCIIFPSPKCEGILAIPEYTAGNVPTNEYWIISHGTSDNIYSVMKTSGASIPNVVNTYSGAGLFTVPGQPVMLLKTNSCFDKILNVFYNAARLEVLAFDNVTGVINTTPLLTLSGNSGAPFLNDEVYGGEFSPNGQFLYVTEGGLNGVKTIYQFDISLGTGTNPAAVIASKKFFTGDGTVGRFGAIQLGPDGKLYVPGYNTAPPSYFSVVPNPDVAWAAVTPTATEFEFKKYTYSGNRVGEGMPQVLKNLLTQITIYYNNACAGSATTFSYVFGGGAASLSWDFGDPASGVLNTSTSSAPSHVYNTAGTYTTTLTIIDNCGRTRIGTVDVIVKEGPEVTVPTGCANTDITLTGTGSNAANYTWSLNSDMSSPSGPSTTYLYNGTLPRTVYVKDPTPLASYVTGNTTATADAASDDGDTRFELFTSVTLISFQVASKSASSGTITLYEWNGSAWVATSGSEAWSGAYTVTAGEGTASTVKTFSPNVLLNSGRYRLIASDVESFRKNNTSVDGSRDVNGVIDIYGDSDGGTKGGPYINISINLPDPCGIRAYVITENCPAPVNLLSFYGEENINQINLFWDVASEINNDYFLVERSIDGVNFKSIGKVEGKGTSNSYGQYTFIDENPLAGLNYYRLVQTDFDGMINYSNIIRFEFGALNINVFPNPFDQSTVVSISSIEEVTVEVLDLLGRKVEVATKKQGEQKVNIGSDLISGTYIIKVIIAERVFASKITKD